MDPLTDDDLVRLFREGDADAFDALFDRHYLSAYRFAQAMLGEGEAEDVLQEAFLAVAQSADRYVANGQFRSWLLRIVRNRCLNRLEARRARQALFRVGGANLEMALADDPPPPRRAEAREQHEAIRRAVAELPQPLREAIILHAFEQMSYRQIATVLDRPVNTVKTLIHRARAELARKLTAFGQGDAP